MKKTYKELLLSPKWQKKRLEIMSRDKFTCQLCSSSDKTLHVHHKYYSYNQLPWDYPDDSLLTICEICHNKLSYKTVSYRANSVYTKRNNIKEDDIFGTSEEQKELEEKIIKDLKSIFG